MKYCLLIFSLLVIAVAAYGEPPNDVFGDPASPPGEELEKQITEQDDEFAIPPPVKKPVIKKVKLLKSKKLPFCKRKQGLCEPLEGSACFCK